MKSIIMSLTTSVGSWNLLYHVGIVQSSCNTENKGFFNRYQCYNEQLLNVKAKKRSSPLNKCLWEKVYIALHIGDFIAQYFLSNYLSLTLQTRKVLILPFPLQVFLRKRTPFLVVIKGNIIFSWKRKGIGFSSCFKSIHRFIAEMTGTGCINHLTSAEWVYTLDWFKSLSVSSE